MICVRTLIHTTRNEEDLGAFLEPPASPAPLRMSRVPMPGHRPPRAGHMVSRPGTSTGKLGDRQRAQIEGPAGISQTKGHERAALSAPHRRSAPAAACRLLMAWV